VVHVINLNIKNMHAHFLRDLGAFMALLEDAPVQQQYPLRVLYMRLWPAMQHQQYELMWQGGHPVAYVNWAWLTPETSVTYRDTQCLLTEADWVAGDQLWFMELIAKNGSLLALVQLLARRFKRGTEVQWHEVTLQGPVVHKSMRLPIAHVFDNSK
jgi:hemolysin-activating ACP:hemolysin acyltransferase